MHVAKHFVALPRCLLALDQHVGVLHPAGQLGVSEHTQTGVNKMISALRDTQRSITVDGAKTCMKCV